MDIIQKFSTLQINYVALLVTTGVMVVLGAFWYSPKIFGRIWGKALSFDMRELKPNPLHYLGAILNSFILVFGLYLFLTFFGINNIAAGMQWAFILWVTFIATTHFSGVIWAKKPLTIYFIDVFYLLFGILISTTLLIIWKNPML